MAEEINRELQLDPKEFAKLVASNLNFDPDTDVEKISKRTMMQYLSAYYLANQFNNYEDTIFNKGDVKDYPSYSEVTALMNQVKWRS
ncbi:MAG: hypothetical protein LKF36_11605 [Lactobacillus sp.]|jgi:hypothetical protein|nr:hypothetical protein [Lactobacillus sp.]